MCFLCMFHKYSDVHPFIVPDEPKISEPDTTGMYTFDGTKDAGLGLEAEVQQVKGVENISSERIRSNKGSALLPRCCIQ